MNAKQRDSAPFKSLVLFNFDPLDYVLILLFSRKVAQVFYLHRYSCTAMHKLERRTEIIQIKRSPQHRMAVCDLHNCRLQFFKIESSAKMKGGDIDEVIRAVLAMKEHARLQPRQWIGIFDIAAHPGAVSWRDQAERPARL